MNLKFSNDEIGEINERESAAALFFVYFDYFVVAQSPLIR